jgi:hypothetical protein
VLLLDKPFSCNNQNPFSDLPCGIFAWIGLGLLWISLDFCNGLTTNIVEIIDYLVTKSEWGSGGRWFKSSRA